VTPAAQDAGALDLRIVTAGVTDEEVAAVTAVITASLDELANSMAVDAASPVSAWQRSQRSVRSTLVPGAGSWRNFSG
jgi:Acyl-CoA carboxylase epsilon subunit